MNPRRTIYEMASRKKEERFLAALGMTGVACVRAWWFCRSDLHDSDGGTLGNDGHAPFGGSGEAALLQALERRSALPKNKVEKEKPPSSRTAKKKIRKLLGGIGLSFERGRPSERAGENCPRD